MKSHDPPPGRARAQGEANTMILAVKIGLVLTSLLAAVCWLCAATVKAPPVEGDDSWVGGSFGERNGAQLIADGKRQQWWNALAAGFATAAALLTAVDAVISH